MQETLHHHHTPISIDGMPLYNLRFADDIDLPGGSSDELQDLSNRLVDRERVYRMEVSAEKGKLVTNSMSNIGEDISMTGPKIPVPRGNSLQRWHLLSRNPHQDCLSKQQQWPN